jgi:hypothetical protein
MTCRKVMDKFLESTGDRPLSLWERLEIGVHILHCSRCAREIEALEKAQDLMKTDFFPAAVPGLEERVMEQIYREEPAALIEAPAGVSFRSWVITGIIVLVSLATVFLGLDFKEVASAGGSSFLLPLGLTIGLIVSGYGALFIGSHLKELSERFNLH